MPHISEKQRVKYQELVAMILNDTNIETKGDLEYLVFKLMKAYMKTREERYSNLHDTVYGVIHSAEEFKRLYLDKREDKAIEENGIA